MKNKLLGMLILVILVAAGCEQGFDPGPGGDGGDDGDDTEKNQLQCSDSNGGKICSDPETGLTWKRCSQQSNDDDSCSYNSSASTYNYCGTDSSLCDTNNVLDGSGSSQAYTACNNLNSVSYGEKSGWRVATIDELDNFYDRFRAIYKSYDVYFQKTGSDVWSASAVSSSTTSAWYLDSSGVRGSQTKTGADDVRCVSD